MTNFKKELICSFIPDAVLIPLTNEAKNSIIDIKNNNVISMFTFPFRIGRESRMSENEKGFFVKLRILSNPSKPNNDIYLFNSTQNLEISKEHFEIEKINNTFFIKDRNSTLGTKLNNEEIGKENANKKYLLKDTDKIKIGSNNSKFEFEFLILK